MKKIYAVAVSVVLSAFIFVASAAPMNGAEFSFRQPDGSLVPVRVWGDEFHQDVESPDGYTLIRGSDGWIYYAELSADGNEYVPTRVRYTGTRSRAPGVRRGLRINSESVVEKQHRARTESGYYEHIGSRRASRGSRPASRPISLQQNDIRHAPQEPERIVGLVVLVDFPDGRANFTRESMDSIFNSEGGVYGNGIGSVYDYFYEMSNGKLEHKAFIFDSIITMDKEHAYYATNRREDFVLDVIKKLDSIGFDPSEHGITTYTNTSERRIIESFSIMFASGSGAAQVGGLWPSAFYNDNGVRGLIGDFGISGNQITPMGPGPTFINMGTLLHELGHLVMDWPDVYSYSVTKDYVSDWCIMSAGGEHTHRPNPYFLFSAGWINTIDITNAPVGALYSHTANTPLAYVYMRNEMDNPSDTAREFYMIENRRRTTRNEDVYNSAVPVDGLQVWHIHTGGDNMARTASNYKYPLVAHRGTFALDLSGREEFHRNHAVFPARYHKDTIVTDGNGNRIYNNEAGVYTGVPSNINIAEISNVSDVMTFKIGDNLTNSDTPHYVISGSYPEFTVTKNGNQFGTSDFMFSESVFTTIINAIRANAAGRECTVQFGDEDGILDLGQETITFTNMVDYYGSMTTGFSNITLSGKITSSSLSGTITISNAISIISETDIENTSANGRAITLQSFDGHFTVSNGEVVATNSSPNSGVIYAFGYSSGTIEVLGGSITNNVAYGNAIYNNQSNSVVSLSLGETPTINGLISGFATGKVSVSENFTPDSRKYILNPLSDARSDGALVIASGAEYFNNFELNGREFMLVANGNDIVLERVPNYIAPTYYIVSGNTKILGDGPVYNFTGFDANIRETVSVPPSGITVQINNPDYLHGAMLTVRNKGTNDSVIVEWFGVMDQSSTDNIDRIAQLFGNGAQINNIATPWLSGVISFDLRSATNETYLVDIEIYNWRNGTGYIVSEDNNIVTDGLFTARRRDNSIIGSPNQPIQTVINAVGLYGGGEEFSLQFGNRNDFLDIDTANLSLLGAATWNNATLLGKLTSTSREGTITLSANPKNEAHIRNTAAGPAIFNGNNFEISGGTISGTYAITNGKDYNNASLSLGGSPTINGFITWYDPKNVSVVTSGDNAFNPGNKKYVLNPLPIRDSMLVVSNGASFLNNFELADTNYILVANGDDLYCYLVIHEDTVLIVEDAPIVTDAQSVAFAVDPIEITIGPNPVSRSTGVANIFLEGSKIRNAELSVYDASGSFINRIRINDNGDSNSARRQVGLWDLADLSGRLVSGGSYIIRGMVITDDGESKNISVVIGVN